MSDTALVLLAGLAVGLAGFAIAYWLGSRA